MRPSIVVSLLLPWLWAHAPASQAHTLGVDKADLIQMKDGSYHLVSHVPSRYQPLITPPELPARCLQEGNPRGARGDYEVRFIFTCESPLTAKSPPSWVTVNGSSRAVSRPCRTRSPPSGNRVLRSRWTRL